MFSERNSSSCRMDRRVQDFLNKKRKSYFQNENEKIKKENQEISKLSFKPKILPNSKSPYHTYEDLEKWDLKRKKKLIVERAKQYRNSMKNSMKKKICKKSKEIFYKSNPLANLRVEERLLLQKKIKDEKIKELDKIKSRCRDLGFKRAKLKKSEKIENFEGLCFHQCSDKINLFDIFDDKLIEYMHHNSEVERLRKEKKDEKNIDFLQKIIEKKKKQLRRKTVEKNNKNSKYEENVKTEKKRKSKEPKSENEPTPKKPRTPQITIFPEQENSSSSPREKISKDKKILENFSQQQEKKISSPKPSSNMDSSFTRKLIYETVSSKFYNEHSDFIDLSSFVDDSKDPHLRQKVDFSFGDRGKAGENLSDVPKFLLPENHIFSKKKPSLGFKEAKEHLNRIKNLLDYEYDIGKFNKKNGRKKRKRRIRFKSRRFSEVGNAVQNIKKN